MPDESVPLEEYKQAAEHFVAYYAHLSQKQENKIWKRGVSIATHWLILIETSNPSQESVQKLIAEATAFQAAGSAALDMYLKVKSWAKSVSDRR